MRGKSQKPSSFDLRVSDFKKIPGFTQRRVRQPARWSLGATREKRAALFSVAQAGGCRGGKGMRARESCETVERLGAV